MAIPVRPSVDPKCKETALEIRNLPDVVAQSTPDCRREQQIVFRQQHNSANASDGTVTTPGEQSKSSFTVTERLFRRRKAQHDECVREMAGKLRVLGETYNARIDELLNEISQKVNMTEKIVKTQLNKLHDENILLQQSDASLQDIRKLIDHHELQLRDVVEAGEAQILQNEQAKIDQMAEIVDDCNKQLQMTGFHCYRSHMLPKEVQVYIEHETLNINQVLLLNRRCLAQLFRRLQTQSILKQKCFYSQWKVYHDQWRLITFEQLAAQLLQQLSIVERPAAIMPLLSEMHDEQQKLHDERTRQLKLALHSLLPPFISKEAMNTWAEVFVRQCNLVVESSQRCLKEATEKYGHLHEQCVDKLLILRQTLIHKHIVEHEDQLSQEPFKATMYKCVLAIGQVQKKLEAEMVLMEKTNESNAARILLITSSVVALLSDASQTWLTHMQSIEMLEQQLEKALRQVRQTHRKNLELKQNHLEMAIDRMRQAASAKLAGREFDLALHYMKEISDTLRETARQCRDIILHYPIAFEQLLTTYFLHLCDYFNVIPANERSTGLVSRITGTANEYCQLKTGKNLLTLNEEFERSSNHSAAPAKSLQTTAGNTPEGTPAEQKSAATTKTEVPRIVVPTTVNTGDETDATAAPAAAEDAAAVPRNSFTAKFGTVYNDVLADVAGKLIEQIALPSQAVVCGRLQRVFGLEMSEQIKFGTLYAPLGAISQAGDTGEQTSDNDSSHQEPTKNTVVSITNGSDNGVSFAQHITDLHRTPADTPVPTTIAEKFATSTGHEFFQISASQPVVAENNSGEEANFSSLGTAISNEPSKFVTAAISTTKRFVEIALPNDHTDLNLSKTEMANKSTHSLHALVRPPSKFSEIKVEEEFQTAVARSSVHLEKFQFEATELREALRNAYLEHYASEWHLSSRNNAVAAAELKQQNITSECDIQLNGLAQRRLIIQREVRDNRLHELRVHDERVGRYVHSICRSMSRINEDHEKLSAQQQQAYEQFRQSMTDAEARLATAENVARLEQAYQHGIDCNEKYLREYAELREKFAKSATAYVAQIRQSNEKFLQTMSLFSDGGNYCADEVAEYERRLAKLATKAETTANGILQEMDAIAQRRQQSSTNVLKMFQERMQENHVDLLVIEKISKQMTRVQLKIKIEASKSNHMHREITAQQSVFEALQDKILDDFASATNGDGGEVSEDGSSNCFGSDVEFIENLYSDANTTTITVGISDNGEAIVAPASTNRNGTALSTRQRQALAGQGDQTPVSTSKTVISAEQNKIPFASNSKLIARQTEQLMHGVRSMMTKINRRSLYLECVRNSKQLQQNSKRLQQQLTVPHQQPASTKRATDSGIESESSSVGGDNGPARVVVVTDGQRSEAEQRPPQHRSANDQQQLLNDNDSSCPRKKALCKSELTDDAANDLLLNIMHGIEVQVPKCAGAESPTLKSSNLSVLTNNTFSKSDAEKTGKTNGAADSGNSNTSQSPATLTEDGVNTVPENTSGSPAEAAPNNSSAGADDSKKKKIPRTQRFLIFGEQPPKKPVSSTSAIHDVPFIDAINTLLWEVLDDLLHSIDEFYRKKGNRAISRPEVIPDQFDQCAQMLTQRLLSLQQQALKYYEKSVVEFAAQLHRFEASLVSVPDIVIHKLTNDFIAELWVRHNEMRSELNRQLLQWDRIRQQNQQLLHPDLGHPRHQEPLARVNENELHRHESICMLAKHWQEATDAVVSQSGTSFLRALLSVSRFLWRLLDGVVTVDDIAVGSAVKRFAAVVGPHGAITSTATAPVLELVLPRELFRFEDEPLAERLVSRKSKKWTPLKHFEETETLVSFKTTLGHLATEASVSRYYKLFERQKQLCKSANDTPFQKLLENENKWITYWRDSIAKIKGIYDDDSTL